MENQTKLITIAMAAAEYGIPRRAIDDAIHDGKLKSYRLQGKTKYLKRHEIDKWIDSKVVEIIKPIRYRDYITNR